MNKIVEQIIGLTLKHVYTIAWTVLIVSVLLSVFVRVPARFQDEQVHYIRSLGVANGQLLSYSKDGDNSRYGHDVNSSSAQYIENFLVTDEHISIDWLGDSLGTGLRSDEEIYYLNTSAAPYMPVPYLPYALGAKISQAINLTVKNEFIIMRLFGAVASLALLFIAFRLSPERYKWTILAIAMIPMSIAAFSAISADSFTIATAILFMATIMRAVERVRSKKLHNHDIIYLGIASTLLVAAKIPLFLMISLILAVMILFRKYLSYSQKIKLATIICITALITVIWVFYAKDINTGAFWGRNVSTIEQLKFIILHPLHFIINLTNSVLSYNYLDLTYSTYANAKPFTNLPFVIDVLLIAGIMMSAFVTRNIKKPLKEQIWMYWMQVSLSVLIVIAVFVLLYLQFTPIGTLYQVDGVQPRYFIPLLPLLAMIPGKINISEKLRRAVLTTPFVGVLIYWIFIVAQIA